MHSNTPPHSNFLQSALKPQFYNPADQQWFCQHLLSWTVDAVDDALIDVVLNEVKFNVDVLRPKRHLLLLDQFQAALIVLMDDC